MEIRNIVCTCCPMGCHMEVTLADGKVTGVAGNTCKRGEAYAHDECVNPTRTLTTAVRMAEGAMLSVKTEKPIPFGKLIMVMKALADVHPARPVRIGDTVLADACGTGVNVIATKNIG